MVNSQKDAPMTRSPDDKPREYAPVHLRLARVAQSLSGAIKEIHRTCDLVEEAGASGVLVVHIQDSARELGRDTIDMPMHSQWERALKRIEGVRAPTVCVIDDDCFGLMLDVMLCTDYRIATPRLELGLARVADTLWPGMAIHRLATQLGAAQARALVLFDMPVDADKACRLSLVHEICDEPAMRGDQFAASLAMSRPQDTSVRRQLLLEAAAATHEGALGTHMAACHRALLREPKAVEEPMALATLDNS
jgi:isomerase DpgB